MSEQAAARAALYRLLALALDYPGGRVREAVASGDYQHALAASASRLGVPAGEIAGLDGADEHLECTYIELFEIGRRGATPCALREGAHVDFSAAEGPATSHPDGHSNLTEELLRFYHYFGLRLSDDPEQKLPPDHVVCQLEMLSHLGLLESRRPAGDGIADGYRDAQRDFLRRHVATWLPRIQQSLHALDGRSNAIRFYTALVDLAVGGVTAHLAQMSN